MVQDCRQPLVVIEDVLSDNCCDFIELEQMPWAVYVARDIANSL